MKQQFGHAINYVAIRTAIISFVLGTLVLLPYKSTSDTGLLAIGYFHTLFAALVNTVLLPLILLNMVFYFNDNKEHLQSIVILLINIPITLFYIEIVI